jgi:hypothetical protein
MSAPPKVVDTDHLSRDRAREWIEMVERSGLFSLPTTTPASPGADLVTYQISVEDGGRRHSVAADEFALPPSLRELVERLEGAKGIAARCSVGKEREDDLGVVRAKDNGPSGLGRRRGVRIGLPRAGGPTPAGVGCETTIQTEAVGDSRG